MARPPSRRSKATDAADAVPAKGRPTKGEKAAARAQRRRERQAHRAGVAAIRRERLRAGWQWLWPEHTRDVGRGKAVAVLVLNVAPFPGLGTALYGRMERGMLQFLLTFLFLVGWVWAVADGVRIVRRAFHGPPHH